MLILSYSMIVDDIGPQILHIFGSSSRKHIFEGHSDCWCEPRILIDEFMMPRINVFIHSSDSQISSSIILNLVSQARETLSNFT